MKKTFKWVAFLIMAILCFLPLQSCGDDEPGSLSGYYTTPKEYYSFSYSGYTMEVIHFVNGNTLEWYGSVWSSSNSDYKIPVKVGKETWYAVRSPQTYTYVYEDNKIIVPMWGKIFTVSGKTIVQEGNSTVYTKL